MTASYGDELHPLTCNAMLLEDPLHRFTKRWRPTLWSHKQKPGALDMQNDVGPSRQHLGCIFVRIVHSAKCKSMVALLRQALFNRQSGSKPKRAKSDPAVGKFECLLDQQRRILRFEIGVD